MAWNARKKSMVYAGTLIVVASGFLVMSAVDAGGLLAPLLKGFEFATERSLSGHTDSLTVIAGRYLGGETSRLAGATVEVQRIKPGHETASGDVRTVEWDNVGETSQARTGSDGRVVFELRSGTNMVYEVRVTHGSMRSENHFNLQESTRVGIYFDAQGAPHFRFITHEDLETYGEDVARVWIFMEDPEYCQTQSDGQSRRCSVREPGYHVEAYAIRGGKRAERALDHWSGSGLNTNAALGIGGYDVLISWEGSTVTTRVDLFADLSFDCLFDKSPACSVHEVMTPVGWSS